MRHLFGLIRNSRSICNIRYLYKLLKMGDHHLNHAERGCTYFSQPLRDMNRIYTVSIHSCTYCSIQRNWTNRTSYSTHFYQKARFWFGWHLFDSRFGSTLNSVTQILTRSKWILRLTTCTIIILRYHRKTNFPLNGS